MSSKKREVHARLLEAERSSSCCAAADTQKLVWAALVGTEDEKFFEDNRRE